MSRRENFAKTIAHQQPDALTIDFGGNPLSCMEGKSMHNLLEYLGFDTSVRSHLFDMPQSVDERILKHFDTDTRAVGEIMFPHDSLHAKVSDTESIDAWGIRRAFTGMYWDIIEHPLKGATIKDLENYRWPNPDSIDMNRIEAFAQKAKRLHDETDYVICVEHPVFGVFELGCWMCGFDDFLMKMALDKPFVHKFFEIILEYQKKVIKKYYGALGKFAHYTSSGDDFATQTSLFLSPEMFRELIMPYFKERIAYTKTFTDAPYLHHSCGSVVRIIDQLIKCGVDILNPIQPTATDMQPENLKAGFGDKIVFHGGIDTQDILPFGTKESIEESVKSTIEAMHQNGGYILAAAHNIQEDVPPQNIVYMLEAANRYGKWNM